MYESLYNDPILNDPTYTRNGVQTQPGTLACSSTRNVFSDTHSNACIYSLFHCLGSERTKLESLHSYNPTILLLKMTKDRPNRVQEDQYIRTFLVALFMRMMKCKKVNALESG